MRDRHLKFHEDRDNLTTTETDRVGAAKAPSRTQTSKSKTYFAEDSR